MALSLEKFVVGPLMENCYLLADEAKGEAVLIDPGEEAARLLEALSQRSLELKEIWLTHAHFDHVGALADIKAVKDVPVYLHPADKVLLEHAQEAAARWDIPMKPPPTKTEDLSAGQTLSFGAREVRCLFTPGHAPGHIAFYVPQEGYVIAGDALFQGSIGRTDLPLGNHAQLIESIHRELLTLPPETVVYPGHGPETTIGFEAEHNPFLT